MCVCGFMCTCHICRDAMEACRNRHGHCPACPVVQGTCYLNSDEWHHHSCCGLPDCEAYPTQVSNGHLEEILQQVDPRLPNNTKRKKAYIKWFVSCKVRGTLPDQFEVLEDVDGDGSTRVVTRYRWSACVLHRVRATFPSEKYMGFKPPAHVTVDATGTCILFECSTYFSLYKNIDMYMHKPIYLHILQRYAYTYMRT